MTQFIDREILLALLRTEPVTDLTAENWQRVTQLAEQHGIRALLYLQLKKLGLTGQVPPDLLQEVRSDYLHTANQNMRIYHELTGLFQSFQQANIPGILLKGAYLAERVYGNLAVRPIGDVDLLVKKSDLARVGEILQELDFIRAYYQPPEPIEELHHFVYEHARNGLMVEIHWDLIDQIYSIHVDIDDLWERSRATLVAGIPMREMAPEDQVLHLCVHTSFHMFETGLKAMCDLTETLRHYQGTLDWDFLHQRGRLWNAGRCLYVNLWLARELLNAPIPEDWLNTLQPADLEPRYLAIARENLFASVEGTGENWTPWHKVGELWAADSLAHKVAFFWQRLFLSRREMALKYAVPFDSLRIFLYYPVRLKNLLQKFGRVAWRLLTGDQQVVSRAERLEQANALRGWLLSE